MDEKEDFLRELGLLGFSTRLKRLSDQLLHDGRKMYAELGEDIEPNWFVIFRLLESRGGMSVTQIAESVGLAHPSVITITNKMMDKSYLVSTKDPDDYRKRVLRLSDRAKKMLPHYQRIWDAGTKGLEKAFKEFDVLTFIDKLEEVFFSRGFKERTFEQMKN